MRDKLFDQIGQFTTIPNTVIRLWSEIGMDAFALFVCLRYHSDENGVSFPSYPKITEETGMSRNRIARAIRALEAYQLLTRKKRFSGSTIYTLVMPSIAETTVVTNQDECKDTSRHESGLQSSRIVTTLVPKRDANQTQLTRSTQPDREDDDGEYSKNLSEITKLIHENLPGLIGPLVSDELREWANTYSVPQVRDAVKIAVENSALSIKYVRVVLQNMASCKAFTPKKNGRKPSLPTGEPTAEDRHRYAEYNQERTE